ncbi:unnamed protein product [Adineta steineri]|uniref:Uncharacterized protein n=1 Tax=Adineta steineri TaxID=433720 RepID=A0A814S665_9BILA|nr:unnamed protein product [Adineta steineri]
MGEPNRRFSFPNLVRRLPQIWRGRPAEVERPQTSTLRNDYPNLFGFVREIYQIDRIKETVNLYEIKKHYFASHLMINPTGIIPRGPEINYDLPHGRDHLQQK